MHDDTKRLQFMLREQTERFLQINQFLQEVIAKVKAGAPYSVEDLCDIGFLCRELNKISDELRKEAEAKKDLIGMKIAYIMTERSVSEPDINMTVHGELATGSPDVKTAAAIPKWGSPEYKALCDYFKIPEEAQQTGMFSVNYNRMADIITRMAEEGKNPPPGVLKTYPKFSTVFRERK